MGRALAAMALILLLALPAWGDPCISCHLDGDPRLKEVFQWRAPQAQEELSLCPVLGRVKGELLSLESALSGLAAELERKQRERMWTRPLQVKLTELRESFRVSRSRPMRSLEELAAQTGEIKRRLLRQVALPLERAETTALRRSLFGWGVLALLAAALLVLVSYGRRLRPEGKKRP